MFMSLPLLAAGRGGGDGIPLEMLSSFVVSLLLDDEELASTFVAETAGRGIGRLMVPWASAGCATSCARSKG